MSNRLRKMRVVDLAGLDVSVTRTVVRVFMLADNIDELEPTTRTFQKAVWKRAQASVRQRGITPTGAWVLAFSALDVADWEEQIAPHLVDQIRAQMRDLADRDLHWRVCALIDTADLKTRES